MEAIVSEYNRNENHEEFLNKLDKFSFFTNELVSLNFKMDRRTDDPTMNFVLKSLKKIPSIENKKILYNDRFINSFYRIFWDLLKKLGIGTQNFYDFIEKFVHELNRITVKDYVLYDCHSTDNYNCGRAMSIINKSPSQFLIYNTDDKGYMDTNTQKMYLSCSSYQPKENLKDVDKKIIQNKYPKFSNRLIKEINSLKFKIKMEDVKNGIKLYLKNGEILITFFIPLDYPFSPPSGTFNDMTISEIDIDWNEKSSLKTIVDKLLSKYKTNAFPKHKILLCYLLDF